MAEAINNEETQFCLNCKKNIAEVNFVIHSVHCQRHIEICKKCSEPVPRKEMAEHLTEFHAIIFCEKCNRHMEKWSLPEHEDVCIKRPISCIYCELNCPWDEIKDHESYCGSRTELCKQCSKFIMIKDQEKHSKCCLQQSLINCPSSPVSPFTRVFSEDIKEQSHARASWNKYQTDRKPVEHYQEIVHPMSETPYKKDLISCPTCHIVVKTTDLDLHKSFCKGIQANFKNKNSDDGIEDDRNRNWLKYSADNDTDSDDDVVTSLTTTLSMLSTVDDVSNVVDVTDRKLVGKQTFEKNHEEFEDERRENISSLSNCQKLNNLHEHDVKSTSVKKILSAELDLENSRVSAVTKSKGQKVPEKNVAEFHIPCPICQKKVSTVFIHDHVVECRLRTEICPICCEKVRLQDKDRHINVCMLKQKQHELGKTKNNNNKPKNHQRRELFTLCPSCKQEFRADSLRNHMVECASRTEDCPICNKKISLQDKDNHINTCVLELNQRDFEAARKNSEKPMSKKRASSKTIFTPSANRNVKKFEKYDPVMLPCEFCEELVPDQYLIQHESGCLHNLSLSKGGEATLPNVIYEQREDNAKPTAIPKGKDSCTSDELQYQETQTGKTIFQNTYASEENRQIKRGTCNNGFYAKGNSVVPGEFLPNLVYPGFPDCYGIYQPTEENRIPIFFGSSFPPLYYNSSSMSDHHASYANTVKKCPQNSKVDVVVNKSKRNSEYLKDDKNVQELEDSDKGSLYESCESDPWENKHVTRGDRLNGENSNEKAKVSTSNSSRQASSSKKVIKKKKQKTPKMKNHRKH